MVCRELLGRTSAQEVLSPCSSFLNPEDLVTRARSLMRMSGLRTLPVVDEECKLLGILTDRELLRVTSTRSNIPVRGLMLPPVLVAAPEDSLLKLARDMLELEVSSVPVVQSPSNRVVLGLVKLEEILRLVAEPLRSSRLKVGDVMTREVTSCTPEDEISRVWDLMEQAGCSGLPVVHRGRVAGMITRSDVLRSGAIRLGEESAKGRFRFPPRVKALMRTPAITTSPELPLHEAIDLMLKRNIGRLPVVEGQKLVGIIARADVVKACLR